MNSLHSNSARWSTREHNSAGEAISDSVDVSVVVCTYNRARQIEQALLHIGKAAARAEPSVEIVVVDNNSSDDTRAVVAAISRESSVPIRYALEESQGLSFARNRGIEESKGSVIAFTDDDCIVEPEWINALWREFVANPDVAILGGRVDLYWPDDKPVTIRPLAERVRYTDATQIYGLIIGCNLAVRRDAVARIGEFDPALGGSKGVVADDIEFVYRAFKQGLGVLFTPAPRVFHNHGRRTDADLLALGKNYVRGKGAFFCKYLLKGDSIILRHAWWEVRRHVSSSPEKRTGLSNWKALWVLASGALHFVLTRARLARP